MQILDAVKCMSAKINNCKPFPLYETRPLALCLWRRQFSRLLSKKFSGKKLKDIFLKLASKKKILPNLIGLIYLLHETR